MRGEWKLLQNDRFSPLERYNLLSDPEERFDVADGERNVFRQLAAALRARIQRGG